MTKEEYNEAAALVVRLRKELEHTNQHLVAHIDALTKSNAQCAEYLRNNEQLKAAKDEMQNALAEATKDLAYSRLAVDTMCARDKRFTSTAALCGAGANEDVGDFIERTVAESGKVHSELVEVRAALASVTEQRDSLRRTLDEWERADTTPHARIDEVAQAVPVCMQCLKERIETAHAYETGPSVAILTKPLLHDDVADHVVPPVLHVGEPDPVNDPKDAALEFRNVVPTPEMIKHVGYWDLVSGAAAIAFKPGGLRLVFWRISGSQEWRTDPCPQPLKPHGMTWQQLDNALANQQPVPMCTTCHGCGSVLYPSPAGDYLCCGNVRCTRSNTKHWHPGCTIGPYAGPCKSATPVRHE